ncbi:MAG: ATP-binding protein [Microlunatus sp.]|nr:ATP-binding protein [Microlunatus sp.]
MSASIRWGLPAPAREDVVLPQAVLTRVERHALGVAVHREALLAAGQHLKRGLLLFGPPGTGKTHTTRYLIGQLTRYTRLLLTGGSLHAIGPVAELARELQPAAVVLEDVDLVAEDRSFGPGSSPVLFDLLDAMDGAAADADLLIVLTTNRSDLLEPALAARPGRVDVAVEHAPLTTATATHTDRALDDLLDSAQQVTRSLLGVGNNPDDLPPGGGLGSLPAHGASWFAYSPRGRRRFGR